MTDFEVNSADYWESRFEGDWAQTQGCEQTRYFARILLDNLPPWLEDEIRTDSLSICDWGCAEGEAVDAFRTHFPRSRIRGIDRSHNALRRARYKFGTESFIDHDLLAAPLPVTFDILATSNVLQYFRAPWPVLRKLGVHAARHLLILVPFRENRIPEHLYTFDDAAIGTHIDPDFILSSCKVIDCHQHSAGDGTGSQILLVYSRSRYFPHSRTTFHGSAGETVAGISAVAGRDEALSHELARATAALESREAELRKLAARETALRSDVAYWQTKAAALGGQLEQRAAIEADLRTGQKRLEEEAARLSASEKNYAAENRLLSSRANTSAYEAATLRRLVTELQSSLSWRITAPLRFLTKPLFRALTSKNRPQNAARADAAKQEVAAAAAGVSVPGPAPEPAAPRPDPIETIIVPALRRAQSVAVVSCALPFSSTLNHRPISCARYFADHGYTVLFVEVWGTPEEPRHAAGEEVYPGILGIPLDAFENNLHLIAPASQEKRAYLCTIPHPGLVGLARPLRAAGYHIHYDIMDDWEEFHRADEADWYSVSGEREMVVLSDTVSAVSDSLVQKFDLLRSDIAIVRNGYQPSALACEQFIAARTPLGRPKVVGYFGHFSDGWFDWDTVFYAAQKRPDIEFELIGWGLSERARVRMKDFPNVRFEGLVPQNNLHRYARKWWAGMIPFQPSTLSAAVDPLKIYEYLYLGLSTVVTGISGIAGYPLVHYAGDRESFVAALDQLPDRPDEQSLSAAAEFLKACVWEERLAKLNSMIGEQAGLAYLYAH